MDAHASNRKTTKKNIYIYKKKKGKKKRQII